MKQYTLWLKPQKEGGVMKLILFKYLGRIRVLESNDLEALVHMDESTADRIRQNHPELDIEETP